MTRRRRVLCTLGFHLFHVQHGDSPATTFRTCSMCPKVWRGTYDGIEPGWERVPDPSRDPAGLKAVVFGEDVDRVGQRRGCIPPYPCGRGAGGNGGDLPCDCEAIADRVWPRLVMTRCAIALICAFAAGSVAGRHWHVLTRPISTPWAVLCVAYFLGTAAWVIYRLARDERW